MWQNFVLMYHSIMARRSIKLLTAAILFNSIPASAQGPLFFDGSVPVHSVEGILLDLAWAGGLNFVQVSTIDLNGDGLEDIFLFDRSGNQVVTLLNTGGEGTGGFVVTREYDQVHPLPELHDWVLLRDYDGDGRKDIFTYSQAGFSVYRNTSGENGLAFELIHFRVNSNYVTSSGNPVIANLYVSQVDLPGIADVDGDGDLDVLTFSLLGSYMEYHKNISMELYGHADSLKFEVRNKCWGYFSENFSDNTVTLDIECPFNVPNPEFPLEPLEPTYVEWTDPRAHAGSTVTPLDLQGDGTMDLLLGDISFNNVVALYNDGTTELAHMGSAIDQFPNTGQPVDLAIFPGIFYEDMDKDGVRDLVVSPNATSLAENLNSMWYYRNIGTDAAPDFQYQTDRLFQDRMLDLGEGAFPVLFDENGDGLMDLVVANHGYFMPGNTYEGRLALLRNTGTSTEPAFQLVTTDYMGLSGSGIGQSMYPAFGDLDGDGDQDMLIGDLQGRIHFYRNTSTGGAAQFQLAQNNIPDASGSVLDVGQFATPMLHDLDGDGLLDLIVGERNGNLNHYRNTGSSSVPEWSLITEELGGVSTVEWWNITGHSIPFLFQNADGDREMLLGSESGWLYHYGGIEGNVDGSWTLLDSAFLQIRDGIRTSVCLYDLTGDGGLDMVIGNYRGGLSFWRSDDVSSTAESVNVSSSPSFSIYPNPASAMVELVLPLATAHTDWIVHDALGKEVSRFTSSGSRTSYSVADLAPGIYHVRASGKGYDLVQRLVVTRRP